MQKRIWNMTRTEKTEMIDDFLEYMPMIDECLSGKIQYAPDFGYLIISDYGISPSGYMEFNREIREKYGARYTEELPWSRMDFEEIVTVMIFMSRSNRHAGSANPSRDAEIYRSMLVRLEDINED
nr:hypothetical protein [uncultured Methanobrevibacter sp.]